MEDVNGARLTMSQERGGVVARFTAEAWGANHEDAEHHAEELVREALVDMTPKMLHRQCLDRFGRDRLRALHGGGTSVRHVGKFWPSGKGLVVSWALPGLGAGWHLSVDAAIETVIDSVQKQTDRFLEALGEGS